MPYKCSLCEYSSNYKKDIVKHINRKNKCSDDLPEILQIKSDLICNICSKKLSTKNSLLRHISICKNKENIRRIEELENKANQHKTINNNCTTNNTYNTYNITLITSYKDPNMDGIYKYLDTALKKMFMSIPYIVEKIHFNDEFPENKNICITNKRGKDAKVFDNGKWITISKDRLLNEIIDSYERELLNYAEEKGKNKFIVDYEQAKKRGNAEKDLMDEVHNIIYDNSYNINTKIKEVSRLILEG